MANENSSTRNGLLGIVGLIIGVLLFFVVLNYFNIISLSTLYPNQLGWLPHKNTASNSSQPSYAPQSIPAEFTLGCPVPNELCSLGKSVSFNGNPAVAYNLPPEIPIKTITPVVDSIVFFSQPYKITNPKGLYQSYILNNYCYVTTYTFPFDIQTKKIDLLPLEKGIQIATSSASAINVNNEKYMLILQIQKKALAPGSLDFQKCGVHVSKPDFGEFQKISPSDFK